ncbi:MAG: nickel pincer cofactor biosynthesis protein LarC [Ignavibacteriales bacterium]|nr:nickel pincer cofactor biosynthesis protein LarC [Ignavibacteriales bacterium]
MKTLYLDCFSGAAGDMFVAAALDLGVDFAALERELAKLGLPQLSARTERAVRSGIAATRFIVEAPEEHAHRHLKDIENILDASALAPSVVEKAKKTFRVIAEAEATVHGTTIDNIHFHEVGALDTIADVVAAAWCVEALGVERIEASAINVGSGFVDCAHGRMPVPAPAVLEILKGVPTYRTDSNAELTTPTGAALVKALASEIGGDPRHTPTKVGYGAGARDLDTPNVLRAVLADRDDETTRDRVVVLETNVDDMNPQGVEALLERLFAEGALDVFTTPVSMKKGRPGLLITVLAAPAERERMADVLFRNTTTIGVRYREERRRVLPRRFETTIVEGVEARVKIAALPEGGERVAPEYDDAKKLADQLDLSVAEAAEAITRAYRDSKR